MAARTMTGARALLPLALVLAAAGSQAQDGIFTQGGFEAGQANPVPGALAFQDIASQRIQPMLNSNYRFDALFPDFNGDGCPDAFIYSHSDAGATSRLWLNNCDGSGNFTYADNSAVAHHIATPVNPRVSGWLALLDFDGDGRQDYWGRDGYAMAGRLRNGTAAGAFLPFFADKTDGCDDYCAFADITGSGALQVVRRNRRVEHMMTRAQILPAAGNPAQQTVGDVTGNGWPDIVQPSAGGYWRNDGGSLTWQPIPAFVGTVSGMGQMALADFDNDGHLDLFAIDDSANGQAYLFRNDGTGAFSNVTAASGLAGIRSVDYLTHYGNSIVADFDNDGRQDLLITGISHSSTVRLFRNDGGMNFTASTIDFGPSGGQGASGWEASAPRADVADFDRDGRLDIVKTQHPGNIGLWRNDTSTNGGRWMKIRVRGPGQNTDGVGAHVRWYRPGSSQIVSHLAVAVGEQHPQTHLHAGLAGNATVDVEVRFPHGGPVYRYNNIASNQEVIVYANGCLLQNWQPGNGWPLAAPAGCGAP